MILAMILSSASVALAQGGGEGSPGSAVPKPAKPSAAKPNAAKPSAAKPAPNKPASPNAPAVVGNYGQWALVCGMPKGSKDVKESCSLVQALVERDSKKLLFRIILSYGPQGHLVLRVDGPTGIALQRGIEFSPGADASAAAEKAEASKVYRLPFQTCVAQGCRALLVVPEELKAKIKTSGKGTLRVFTLDGRAVQTATDLSGFTEGLAALDKRRQAQVN